jgi:hypothetical protein
MKLEHNKAVIKEVSPETFVLTLTRNEAAGLATIFATMTQTKFRELPEPLHIQCKADRDKLMGESWNFKMYNALSDALEK